MFNRFTKEARLVVGDSIRGRPRPRRPDRRGRAPAARGHQGATRPSRASCGDAGLDFDGLSAALNAETARSLAAVGVTADAPALQPLRGAPAARHLRQARARTRAAGRASRAATSTSAASTSRSAPCAPRPAPSPARSNARASTASS